MWWTYSSNYTALPGQSPDSWLRREGNTPSHENIMSFDLDSYFFGESIDGIKIGTSIPFSSAIPYSATIFIKGVDDDLGEINFQISWHLDGGIISSSASTSGGMQQLPRIALGDDGNGNVAIFLHDYTPNNIHFEVSASMSQEWVNNNFYYGANDWVRGWYIDNCASMGSFVDVPVTNSFSELHSDNVYTNNILASGINSNTININDYLTVGGGLQLFNFANREYLNESRTLFNQPSELSSKVLTTDLDGNVVLVPNIGANPTQWVPDVNTTAVGDFTIKTNPNTIGYGGHVFIGNNPSHAVFQEAHYRLVVDGTIGARKVKVTQSSWADYVFNRDYKLQPLIELEKFIKKYGHLPEMPTTSQVEKDGVDIGETQALLLKKIEELTLHLIELNKKLEEQNRKIQNLEKIKK